MNQELRRLGQTLQKKYHQKLPETIALYPGIDLTYLEFTADRFQLHHEPLEHILQINFCRSGRIGWQMGNGSEVYLGPGDFSIHSMKACQDSILMFPTGFYSGLVICIDLQETAKQPPELLKDTDLFPGMLPAKFCKYNAFTSIAGNAETEAIFSQFYDQPEAVRLPYQKMKVLELLLYLIKIKPDCGSCLTEYRSEQANLIREIHDYLLEHLDQRFTIQDLSRKYLINPTTLKDTFKSVYGISLATHMKEHRMEHAAKMLRETDLSISEIARQVGYDSQSRFSDTFKAFYQTLPKEYRRQHSLGQRK